MSFGASPSDIIIVVTFCRALYRKCRDSGGEYDEISREVRALHTVLRHLKYEVEAPESPLNKDRTIWGRQLAPIIGDCDFTLRQLDGLIMKYGRLASNGNGGSPTSPRILWDKIRFGSNEMDQLGGIRVKLISHKTSLTLFLDTIQLHQSGKMATTLDNHGGQLDVILDKVDNIAARMTQKSGSVMTNYEDDDKEVWKQFRRELVAEGFSSDDVLRAYIRQIDQEGLLTEVPTDPQVPSPLVGQNTDRWLESVQPVTSAPSVSSKGAPPSFDSLDTGTDDSGAKEMVIREENMKFHPSMKMERPKPETRRNGVPQRQLEIPASGPAIDGRSSDSQRQLPAASKPKLITSDEKNEYYLNTDGSSDEDSECEDEASKRSKSPSAGHIIKTSELIAKSQALTVRRPGSATGLKANQSSVMDDDAVPRSMAYRPKKLPEFGASPSRPDAFPIPNAIDRLGTSPRPEPARLAPDSQGNEIPADAKWTKIDRRLVSPEVLDQDHKRYEARPDFVAVLGVLSRVEIQSLAARSHELRVARHRRNHPPPQTEIPPPQPPRPIPVPIPAIVQQTHYRGGRDTPSSESDQHSSDSDHNHKRRPRYQEHRTFPNYTHSPNTGYPNPFGQPVAPPSPTWSAVGQSQQTWMPPPPQEAPGRIWSPASPQMGQQGAAVFYPPSSRGERRDRDRERDREPRRRHSSPPRSRDRERDRERNDHRERDGHGVKSKEKEKTKEKEKSKSRWKENLTAAGMGGAAVSLLNVLSEAAEGL